MKKWVGQALVLGAIASSGIWVTHQVEAGENIIKMHRMYNPNSGEHFYTANYQEKNNLVKSGWKYEGIGWYAPTTGQDVYRLYNPNNGDHHYTTSFPEKDNLVKVGWKYEGIGWKSSTNTERKEPLYRVYNPNNKGAGSHHYTINRTESQQLVSLGWKDEGIGWYAAGLKQGDAIIGDDEPEKIPTPTKKTFQYTYRFIEEKTNKVLQKNIVVPIKEGEQYSYTAPEIKGYTLVNESKQGGVANGNKTFTFSYKKNVYTVTVKHVDTSGKVLSTTSDKVEEGQKYTAKSISIPGYYVKGYGISEQATQQISAVNGNTSVTFTYVKSMTATEFQSIVEKGVFDNINKARVERGLNPLVHGEFLQKGTDIRANEITQLFSHDRPNGESAGDAFIYYEDTDRGDGKIWRFGGENIYRGKTGELTQETAEYFSRRIVDAWIASPGHASALFNEKAVEQAVGVRAVKEGDSYTVYSVYNYGFYTINPQASKSIETQNN